MAKKIFVGNLSFQTSENDLNDLFAPFGEGESVGIMTERDTGADRRTWPGWVRRRVDRSSENDASSSATRKSLLLTSKSETLASKSLFLTSKSEMLTRKSLFLTSKSEMLARKSLFLTSKSEMLTRKSLFLTSKSEMLARKSLFLIGKVKRNKNHSRLFIVSSKIWTLPSLSQ